MLEVVEETTSETMGKIKNFKKLQKLQKHRRSQNLGGDACIPDGWTQQK